jgi:hypothetical protein
MWLLRSNRRWGGYLALFALALQLVLSMGHVHPGELSPATSPAVNSHTANATSPSLPGDNDNDAYCDICATMALAGSLVLPQLPVLEIPAAFERIQPAIFAADFATHEYSSFKARAPPLA